MDTVFTGHRENTHFIAISRSPQEDLDEGEREWSEASSSSFGEMDSEGPLNRVDGVMTMEWSDDGVDPWKWIGGDSWTCSHSTSTVTWNGYGMKSQWTWYRIRR